MNQPGTSTQYPNWRLPLVDGVGRPVLLEELYDALRVTGLAATVADGATDPADDATG
jgi:4-alpha-glucanotransferase